MTNKSGDVGVLFTTNWNQIRNKSLKKNWIVLETTHSPQERWIATYANLVGQRSLFNNLSTTNIQIVIDGLDHGLPTQAIDRVTNLMGLNRSIISKVLDISPRTLSRRNVLKASVSERLFRISNLFQKTLEVLGDKDEAQRWFSTPKKALGGKTPLEFSESDIGTREVEDLLGRIEYGVYA